MKLKNILALIGFYIPVLFVQSVGALITRRNVDGWYATLEKSVVNPPDFVFGLVWTVLYLLMTVAAWRVWRVERKILTAAQRAWFLQLILGLLWTMAFFGMKSLHEGFALIACVVLAVILTLRTFAKIDRIAAALIMPLFVWVSFASYLMLVIVLKN